MKPPTVYFVGAGPGDPGLITVKGAALIARADCIIYDGLANPALLDAVDPSVETICVAKRSGHHSYKQDTINALIVDKAKQYQRIVRLKGGDPCLFGRAVEEIRACLAAGLAFEIVPGITAGIAAAAYAGIFLTDRDHTSAVSFVTGHDAEGKPQTDVNWDALANCNGSLVIYMGMGNLDRICQTLVAQGKPAETPAAVIHRATDPRQTVVTATLADIAARCQARDIGAPAIVIIGPSAAGIEGADWFARAPLFGRRVVITRDAAGNVDAAARLHAQGAVPVRCDAIELADLTAAPAAQAALRNLGAYDWILFTSANGVRYTFSALDTLGGDGRAFAGAKIACIGSQTAAALAGRGLRADRVPAVFTSTALAEALTAAGAVQGQSILLLRSAIAPDDLPAALAAGGATVADVSVYTVRPRKGSDAERAALIEALTARRVDWLTFTSSSTVDALLTWTDAETVIASGARIASIGPFTTAQLNDRGLPPDIEAAVHTVDGLLTAMGDYRD